MITRGAVLHGDWIGFEKQELMSDTLSISMLPHWGQYAGILIFYNVPARVVKKAYPGWCISDTINTFTNEIYQEIPKKNFQFFQLFD